jgi:REP element-mobilizing transposase RayT
VSHLLGEAGAIRGWKVGRYVVMPDHLHFFCSPGAVKSDLSGFVGAVKQAVTRKAWELGWSGAFWQREFHDHLLRTEESYRYKWEYVRRNPVAKGLCEEAEDWPYQGEIDPI